MNYRTTKVSSVEAAGTRVIESGVVLGLAILARSQGNLVIRYRRASDCADRRRLNARLRRSYSPESSNNRWALVGE